jgi:folylpolyglutamate synthase/dihydropteroate synthase
MSTITSINKTVKSFPLCLAATTATVLAINFVPSRIQQIDVNQAQIAQLEAPTLPSVEQENKTPLLLLAIAAGAAGLVLSFQNFGNNTSRQKQSANNSIYLNQANSKQRKLLLRLLHNDVQAANRLLAFQAQKHPSKSIDWYMEKVIYDLQRDLH